MDNILDTASRARLNTQRILFFALSSSNAVFAALCFVAPPHAPPESPVMLFALIGVSVMVLGVSFVLPSQFEQRGLAALEAAITERAGADMNVPSALAKHSVTRVFAEPKRAFTAALDRTLTPFILRMALREAVGIYGLVLVFLGYPPGVGLGFIGVSAAAQLLAMPSPARIADALERAKGASLGPR